MNCDKIKLSHKRKQTNKQTNWTEHYLYCVLSEQGLWALTMMNTCWNWERMFGMKGRAPGSCNHTVRHSTELRLTYLEHNRHYVISYVTLSRQLLSEIILKIINQKPENVYNNANFLVITGEKEKMFFV